MFFENTRWLIGRKELKQLRLTTLKTFFKVCREYKIKAGIHFSYNQGLNIITFPATGSEIILSELAYRPSDPDFASLGSLELTGAFVDEAAEIDFAAFDVLKSRVGRQANITIKPRILLTCNPSKNWLFRHFYQPYKKGRLAADAEFIQSLPTDNEMLAPAYLEQLQSIADPTRRARLLHGDWEYSREANELFIYEKITDLFTNEFLLHGENNRELTVDNRQNSGPRGFKSDYKYNVPGLSNFDRDFQDPEVNRTSYIPNPKYISIDAARMGSDRAVIILWRGFCAMEFHVFDTSRTTDISSKARHLATQYQIPMSRVVCDADGVGGGVADELGCEPFHNNASPKHFKGEKQNYENLKTQCYYRFANRVNSGGVYIADKTFENEITEELAASRRDKMDSDGKLCILKKETLRHTLGRSPDFADALMMREYFELKPRGVRIYV
jgi:phage terminase large subunit